MGCNKGGVPIDGGGSTPCVDYYTLAYRVGNQTIASGVKTVIDFTNIEAENPAGFFNLATDQATIPTAGIYTVTGTAELLVSATGVGYMGIEINGVPYSIQIATTGPFSPDDLNFACTITRYMAAGDIINAFIHQFTGFNATVNGTTRRVNLSISSANIT